MANKYKKEPKDRQGHNGTVNGIKGKKNARRAREQARQATREAYGDTRNPKTRLERLDALGLVAKRERTKLQKQLR